LKLLWGNILGILFVLFLFNEIETHFHVQFNSSFFGIKVFSQWLSCFWWARWVTSLFVADGCDVGYLWSTSEEMGALWSVGEPASVFIQCYHNIKAGQNSWVIRSSCFKSYILKWWYLCRLFYCQKDWGKFKTCGRKAIHHIFRSRDLWRQRLSCLGWWMIWGNEFSFCWSCGNMWLAEREWRFHVICYLSDDLCSLVRRNINSILHVNASMLIFPVVIEHTVEDALAIKVLNILVL